MKLYSNSLLQGGTDEITRTAVMRVLVSGFTLVILLLLGAGFWGLQQIQSIQDNVENLEAIQAETAGLIDALADEQTALDAVLFRLSGNPQSLDREAILAQLDRTNQRISQMSSRASGSPDESLWRELQEVSTAFAVEAKRLLALDSEGTLLSRDLLLRHNQIAGIVSRLSESSHRNSLATQRQLRILTQRFVRNTSLLLGTCLLLALICSVFTVRVTGRLFRKMEWQTGELNRVSWNLLQKQEEAARRFSHELHDELGQSLTALRANVDSLTAETPPGPERLDSIAQLLDGAVGNVRQLSQLLRPTILDDFGLDASLRWLTENFSKHTGIEISYQSEFNGRLPEQTETHLFRIAQEALTNVAKHSKASRVEVALREISGSLMLSISDNGKGMSVVPAQERRNGLGLIGMRARARVMEGELNILQPAGGGLRVEVCVRKPMGEKT